MKEMKINYYKPEVLGTLRQHLQMSDSTWHRVMNPLCINPEHNRTSTEQEKTSMEKKAHFMKKVLDRAKRLG